MATNLNQIFQYNGSPISFQKGDSVMVNATEMAKPFGKSATHWLRNQSTKEFINEYAALRNCNPVDLVQITRGGLIIALKNQSKALAIYKIICIFAVLQIIIIYAKGIFLCPKSIYI